VTGAGATSVDAGAIERMLRASLEWYAHTAQRVRPGGPVRMLRTGGVVAMDNGRESHRSRVVGLGLEGPADEAEFDAVDAFFAETGSAYNVEVAPCTDAGAAALLAARGLIEQPPITVLTRVLSPGPAAPTEWAGGRIRRAGVDDAPGVARVFARGFGGHAEPNDEDLLAAAVAVATPSTAVFIALSGDEPVACGAVQAHGSLALIFAGGTVPEARRLGAHRALVAARLAWAAEMGCSTVVVQMAQGAPSAANLRRAGFEPAYQRRPFKRAAREPGGGV